MTIILGIDPGTRSTGYGVVEDDSGRLTLVDCGALTTSSGSPIGERLSYLYHRLLEITARYHPEAVAVEQPFVAKNVRSALAIGRAQAIAILAAADNGVPIYEYTPSQIKRTIANYGASSKKQVQEMVKLQLGLATPPEPSDAADALAVAICHLHEVHLSNLIRRQSQEDR